VCLGAACAAQQLAWFLAPFLLIGLYAVRRGELGRRPALAVVARYTGTAALTWAAINAYFATQDFHTWLDGLLLPLTQKAILHGQGAMGISYYFTAGSSRLDYYSYGSLLLLLGLAWLTIGERPNGLGVAGVVLSAAGVYLLNVRSARISPWAPLLVLFTDRGQRYTLLAAALYAPSVITIKQAILASNTAAGTFGAYFAASVIVTPIALRTSARHFRAVPQHWKEFAALGLFAALTTLSQGKAYTLTLSSYVEALKQIEILFAMAIGVLVFGEARRVKESALGASVMLLGMVLLALAT